MNYIFIDINLVDVIFQDCNFLCFEIKRTNNYHNCFSCVTSYSSNIENYYLVS